MSDHPNHADRAEHSPTPWHVEVDAATEYDPIICTSWGTEDPIVNELSDIWGLEQRLANADFIVRAVNAYDELVDALEQCVYALRLTREYVGEDTLPAIEGWSWFDASENASAALARAKGGS